MRPVRSSSVYDTDPVGPVPDQPAFLNACVEVAPALGHEELIDAAKAVEREVGRAPGSGVVDQGPRAIDVDVLLLADVEHASERLRLPHEDLLERRFVLVPLLELDLEATLPDGRRAADALVRLPLDEGVRRAGPPLKVG